MSLAFAILAAVENQERSGYDIARAFDHGVGYFWQASHQQIYRELARLAGLGRLAFDTVEQQRRPAKKVYHITPAGRDALQAWLETPAAAPKIKDELLVRLYAGSLARREVLLEEVRRHETETRARFEEYRAIEAQFFDAPEQLPRALRFIYLTLRKGIVTTAATLDWFDEVIAFLEQT